MARPRATAIEISRFLLRSNKKLCFSGRRQNSPFPTERGSGEVPQLRALLSLWREGLTADMEEEELHELEEILSGMLKQAYPGREG